MARIVFANVSEEERHQPGPLFGLKRARITIYNAGIKCFERDMFGQDLTDPEIRAAVNEWMNEMVSKSTVEGAKVEDVSTNMDEVVASWNWHGSWYPADRAFAALSAQVSEDQHDMLYEAILRKKKQYDSQMEMG